MAREPLRCLLIVSLQPSSLALYSRYHAHRGEEGRKEEMRKTQKNGAAVKRYL